MNYERSNWPKLELDKYKFRKGRHGSRLDLELKRLRQEIAFLEYQIRMIEKPFNDETLLALDKIVPA